jgi:hypothetical protein
MKILSSRISSFLNPLICILILLACVMASTIVFAQAAKPDLPDLNVLYISRTPRYPGYVLKYQALPGSGKEWMPCVADPETGEALPLTGMEKDANGK